MHALKLLLLPGTEFRLPAAQLPLGPSNRHALPGAHPDQVRLKLSESGQDIEEQFPHRISRIVNARTNLQFHAPLRQLITDCPGIRYRPCQPVKFRHDKRVATTHSCQRLIKTRPSTIRTSKPLIRVDTVSRHAQIKERLFLRSEILLVS